MPSTDTELCSWGKKGVVGKGGEPSPSAVTGKAPALTLSRRSRRRACPLDACRMPAKDFAYFSGTPLPGARHALTVLQKVLFVVTHLVSSSFLNIRPQAPFSHHPASTPKQISQQPCSPPPQPAPPTYPNLYSHLACPLSFSPCIFSALDGPRAHQIPHPLVGLVTLLSHRPNVLQPH